MTSITSSRSTRTLAAAVLLSLSLLATGAVPSEAQRRVEFPTQAVGNRGVEVTALQHLLRARGQTVRVSGIFSAGTQAGVADFQRSAGLPVSGVADAATWQKLAPPLADDSSGEAVLAAQKLLERKAAADLQLTGFYDADTRRAVRRFQREQGLTRSGEMDLSTWRQLLSHFAFPTFRKSSMCNYHSGNGKAATWGTGTAIGQLEAAAALFHERTGLDVSVGEISRKSGGRLSGHSTHRIGLDVDLGLIRKDGRHCRRLGTNYRQAQYDRDATRELIEAIHDTAPGKVKLIYFNDPVLIREGLVRRYPNHHHHLHVRYCEVGHADRRYRCETPRLPSRSALQAALAAELGEDELANMRPPLSALRVVQRF